MSVAKRILYVTNSLFAMTWYRCAVPGVVLMQQGHEVEIRDVPWTNSGQYPDILVSQASLADETLEMIDRVNTRGGLTIYDMDDDPWALHPENPGYPFWQDPETQHRLIAVLRAVQKVTVTTPEIAERFSRFNRDVTIIPNMLPATQWPAQRRETRDTDSLVVGWAGSASHRPDLREIDGVLFDLLDKYPHVEVHLAGAEPGWLSRSHERLRFLEPVPILEYPDMLAGFDIGLAPLLSNRFNDAKSDLKALEYAMAGVPMIASPISDYRRCVKPGETGFFASKYADWMKHLRALIESAALRDSIAEKARAWAETRTIEDNMAERERVYGLRS